MIEPIPVNHELINMDDNLFYVLVGTGVISLLTLVYVMADEGLKKRRYQQQKPQTDQASASDPPPAPSDTPVKIPTPPEPGETVVELASDTSDLDQPEITAAATSEPPASPANPIDPSSPWLEPTAIPNEPASEKPESSPDPSSSHS